MRHLRVVQIGYGTVGGAVLEQIAAHRASWRDRLRIDVTVVAVGGRAGAVQVDTERGIDEGVREERDDVIPREDFDLDEPGAESEAVREVDELVEQAMARR